MPVLSPDLRDRIVSAYNNNEGSYQTLAERFCVSKNTVMDLVHLHQRTGALDPQYRSTRQPTIAETEHSVLQQWLNEEMTQEQIAHRYEQTTGKAISQASISPTVKRMG